MEPDHDPADDTATPGHRPRPWSKRVPADRGPFDTIVIGSGIGGMTTAALLARAGQRVLVLEQHYVPGGFTHSFKRPGGYHWDVGVHAVGEVTQRSLTGRLLTSLTDDRLQWASLGPVYDEFDFPGGLHLDFPDTPQRFRENLLEAFPAEQRAIDGYLHRVREVAGSMRRYYLARLLPARDMLVQPFLPEIVAEGEWSLLFLGGQYSHAVKKRSRAGEFRVQADFGGSVEADVPRGAIVAQAEAIVAHLPQPWLYARVDACESAGALVLMELELIEPDLFLGQHPSAPRRFASALRHLVAGRRTPTSFTPRSVTPPGGAHT